MASHHDVSLSSFGEMHVRNLSTIAFLSTFLGLSPNAMAMQVICPPLVREGMIEFAASYTQKTGIPVIVKADVMGKILDDIKAAPGDVVLLPSSLMETLAKDGGVKADTRQKIGRVEIASAVRPGVPHPDISTVTKLSNTLRSARTVAYTQPGPPRNSMEAGIIDRILHRPDFSGAHLITVTTGSGVSALAKGDADMALQVTPEIMSRKDVELVGPLPPELAAHIDVDAAISANAADPQQAMDLIRYLTRPEAAQEWKKFGLNRQDLSDAQNPRR
jgi:molybdate transport system substrate-binding protein